MPSTDTFNDVEYKYYNNQVNPAPTAVPANSTTPTTNGVNRSGDTISAGNGAWTNSPTSYTYQWRRGTTAIPGATASTYRITDADIGSALNVQVIASNLIGASTTATSTSTANVIAAVPVNVDRPFSLGTLSVGSTLTANTGTWTNSPVSYTYQWTRDGFNIASATNNTYQLTTADQGKVIAVDVTATNTGGSSAAVVGLGNYIGAPTTVSQLFRTLIPIGDSNTQRNVDSQSDASITASGGVATITLNAATPRDVVPGQTVHIYLPGQTRLWSGYRTVATRISNTQFTVNYTGTDNATAETWSVGFPFARVDTGYVNWALGFLNQGMEMIYNAGVGGENSTQMLARIPTDVVAKAPQVVSIMIGGNDASQSVDPNVTIANINSAVDQCIAAGIKVVLMTPRPASAANLASQGATLTAVSNGVRAKAATDTNNIRLVDVFNILVNSGTGAQQTWATHDGAHFTPEAARRVGREWANVMSTWAALPTWSVSNPGNVVPNSLMVDSNADGTADNVTLVPTNATIVPSIVASPYPEGGNMQRVAITATAAGGTCQINLASVHAGLTVGSRIRFFFRVRTTGTSIRNIVCAFNMTSNGILVQHRALAPYTGVTVTTNLQEDVPGLLFATEWLTVPASTTAANLRVQGIADTTGTFTLDAGAIFSEVSA